MSAPLSILAIEDDPMIRSLLQAFFELPSYRVRCESGGAEGLRALREEKFDLVLTDLMMPGHDGWEMIALIHRDHPVLPIILVSGSLFCSGEEGLAQAKALGAADVLSKPFSRAQLFAAIERAVRPSAAADARV